MLEQQTINADAGKKAGIKVNKSGQKGPPQHGIVYESPIVRRRKPGLRVLRPASSGFSEPASQQKLSGSAYDGRHSFEHKPRIPTLDAPRCRRHGEIDCQSSHSLASNALGIRTFAEVETAGGQLRQRPVITGSKGHSSNHRIKADAGGDHIIDPPPGTTIYLGYKSSKTSNIKGERSGGGSHVARSKPHNALKIWITNEDEDTQIAPIHINQLETCGDTPKSKSTNELQFSKVQNIKIPRTTHEFHPDMVPSKTDKNIIHMSNNIEPKLRMRSESVQSLSLLIESLKTDIDVENRRFTTSQVKIRSISQQVEHLGSKLNASRVTGIKLEAANGRVITESMKNKYLRMECDQLSAELDRRKSQFATQQLEKRDLSQELERLKHQKTQYERHYKDALLESKFTTERLREMDDKCKSMEVFRDEEKHLLDMMCNLQAALGRVRVFGILKTTPHESCVQYVSSNEIILTPPTTLNLQQRRGDAVRCRLSYIVPPGSCNALELFNEIITTIDGITDGLNACLVTVGPRRVGKSSTIFGEPRFWFRQSTSPKLKRNALVREWKTRFKRLSRSISFDFGELTRSVEFASLYGLLGLCLVHLLQLINLKTTIDTNAEDFPGVREYRIRLAAVLIPLCSEKPEFDLLANDYINHGNNDKPLAENESNLYSFNLEYQNVANLSDILYVCDALQSHLRRYDDSLFLKYDAAHKVVIADVHMVSQEVAIERHLTTGVVVFVDTFGLNHDAITLGRAEPNEQMAQSTRAWNDVSSLIEMMQSRTNPKCFERNRLLRLVQPCVLPGKPHLQRMNCTACMVLLHLPCDKQQAYIAMQCLRLGLWVMNEDQDKYFMARKTDGSNGFTRLSESSKDNGTCFWRIGLVGHGSYSTSTDSSENRKFAGHISSAVLGRSNSLCGQRNINLKYKSQKIGASVVQRTSSIG